MASLSWSFIASHHHNRQLTPRKLFKMRSRQKISAELDSDNKQNSITFENSLKKGILRCGDHRWNAGWLGVQRLEGLGPEWSRIRPQEYPRQPKGTCLEILNLKTLKETGLQTKKRATFFSFFAIFGLPEYYSIFLCSSSSVTGVTTQLNNLMV